MFSNARKAEVVRRHVKDKVPVSQLAAELDVQPSQIHQWIEVVLTRAEAAFDKDKKKPKRSAKSFERIQAKKIHRLEEKLITKNEVIAELMEENVKAKKLNGDL